MLLLIKSITVRNSMSCKTWMIMNQIRLLIITLSFKNCI